MGCRHQAWLSIHRRLCCRVLLGVILVTTAATLVATFGCATQGLRAVVSMRMVRSEKTPRDASVYIDEQYIGPLYYVAAYGVSLPRWNSRTNRGNGSADLPAGPVCR